MKKILKIFKCNSIYFLKIIYTEKGPVIKEHKTYRIFGIKIKTIVYENK